MIHKTNIRHRTNIRQTLAHIKGEIERNTIIIRDFNNSLTPWTDHENRKLISKHKS